MRQRSTHLLITSLFLLVVSAPRLQANESPATATPSPALQAYVAKPDATYQWKKRREGTLGEGSYAELILTSQTWRDIAWKHQLFVYRPAEAEPRLASAAPDCRRIVEGGARTAAGPIRLQAAGRSPYCRSAGRIACAPRWPCCCKCPSNRCSAAWSRTRLFRTPLPSS